MERLISKFCFKFIFTLFCLASYSSAFAQGAYTYAPEGCDFSATFPTEPHFTQRCPSDATQPCYELAQYTHRDEMDKTINVEMSCTLVTPELYKTYTRENLEYILYQMVQDSNLSEPPPISYQEEENDLKIISTSGLKTAGFATKIFVTQVWLSKGSLLTVDGEMSLEKGPDGDKLFADILRSVTPKHQSKTK